MSQPIWQKLIALVELDHQASSLKKEFEKIEKEILNNQTKIKNLENILQKIKSDIQEKKKHTNSLELKIKEASDQEKHKREILNTIKDQKSHKAILKEISILETELRDLEDAIVSSWNEVETLEKKFILEEKNFQEQSAKLNSSCIELNNKKEELLTQQKTLTDKKALLSSEISPEWQTKYEKMQARVPNPIVPIINSSCSACFYMLLSQDLAKIKKGGVLHCRNCYRLLYFNETEKKDEPKY